MCTDLVAQGALLCAYVCDEVAGLLGHLVQEHVAKGQAAVSDVVPLQGGTDMETLVEISLSTTRMLSETFDFQHKSTFHSVAFI